MHFFTLHTFSILFSCTITFLGVGARLELKILSYNTEQVWIFPVLTKL
jgi:hypothetical protein